MFELKTHGYLTMVGEKPEGKLLSRIFNSIQPDRVSALEQPNRKKSVRTSIFAEFKWRNCFLLRRCAEVYLLIYKIVLNKWFAHIIRIGDREQHSLNLNRDYIFNVSQLTSFHIKFRFRTGFGFRFEFKLTQKTNPQTQLNWNDDTQGVWSLWPLTKCKFG